MYYMIILVIYKLLHLFGGVLGVFVKIKDQTKKKMTVDQYICLMHELKTLPFHLHSVMGLVP